MRSVVFRKTFIVSLIQLNKLFLNEPDRTQSKIVFGIIYIYIYIYIYIFFSDYIYIYIFFYL